MRFNYCGPFWSNGVVQASIVGGVEPLNELDDACMQHDAMYASNANLKEADLAFYRETSGLGLLGYLFGAAVGLQGLARPEIYTKNLRQISDDDLYQSQQAKTNMPQNRRLRGSGGRGGATQQRSGSNGNGQSTVRRQGKANGTGGPQLSVSAAPVSFGNKIVSRPPITKITSGGSRLTGVDFIGEVVNSATGLWTVGNVSPLHPAFYIGSNMGNMCRMFAKTRFLKQRIHYISKTATSSTGDVLLSTSRQVLEAALNTQSSTFLNQAMTRGQAVLARVWENSVIEIPCDGEWTLTNPLAGIDIDDNIKTELEVYIISGTSSAGGYLLMEYDVEFKESFFTPYSSFLPTPAATIGRFVLGDKIANVAGNAWILAGGNLPGLIKNGSIYKFVMDIQNTTFGAGLTAATQLSISTTVGLTTTTTGTTTVATVVEDGQAIYGVCATNDLYMYGDLASAIAGDVNAMFTIQTTAAVVTTWSLWGYPAHYGPVVLTNNT